MEESREEVGAAGAHDTGSEAAGGPEPWVWFTLAATATFLPFLLNWGVIGVADFDQFAAFNQIALWWHSLGDYHVAWDPFLCGGATLVGNPQVPLFHPNMLLYRLLGPVNGLGASFLPWMLAGFWGMKRLAQQYGLRRVPAAWIATAFVVNGFFTGQLGSMHVMYSAFYLLPILFLLNRTVAQRGDWRALAILPFALALPCLYNHHFIAYGFPFVVAHFVLELWPERRASGLLRKLLLYGLGVVLALGILSIFLLPNFSWNSEFPRAKPGEFENPLSLIQMLLLPYPILDFELQHDPFERYYALGPVLFLLFLLGLRRRIFAQKALRPLVLLAGLAFVTAIGSLEPFGLPPIVPFDLLKAFVPGYQAIRVPSRFFIVAIPAILLITGLAWQQLIDSDRFGPSAQRWILAGALVPLLLFHFGYLQFSLFSEERGVDEVRPAEPAGPFSWAPAGYSFQMMRVLEPNVGVLDCYEALEVPQAEALRRDRGIVLEADPSVEVERIDWGELVVRAPTPSTVRFNFNHHRHWAVVESDGEASIRSENYEPLMLRIDDGSFARLRYTVPAWTLGTQISLASFAFALLFAASCLLAWRRTR